MAHPPPHGGFSYPAEQSAWLCATGSCTHSGHWQLRGSRGCLLTLSTGCSVDPIPEAGRGARPVLLRIPLSAPRQGRHVQGSWNCHLRRPGRLVRRPCKLAGPPSFWARVQAPMPETPSQRCGAGPGGCQRRRGGAVWGQIGVAWRAPRSAWHAGLPVRDRAPTLRRDAPMAPGGRAQSCSLPLSEDAQRVCDALGQRRPMLW
jgi:hypothetical protein